MRFALRLSPEPDALVRVLTVAIVRPGEVRSLAHVRDGAGSATLLEIAGMDAAAADLLERRLEQMPCVEAVRRLAGAYRAEAAEDGGGCGGAMGM